jgi:hypothetical protein
VPLRAPGGDHHGIGEGGFAGKIDLNEVLGFGVFQTLEDHLEGGRRCEFTAGGRKTRRT